MDRYDLRKHIRQLPQMADCSYDSVHESDAHLSKTTFYENPYATRGNQLTEVCENRLH